MIFERQRYLLALLDALGGEAGKLDFQKLLFLYSTGENRQPIYEFVPYKYGAFSFTSNADLCRLADRGLLTAEEKSWRLTSVGHTEARINPIIHKRVLGFVQEQGRLRGDALIAATYRRFPYYAIHSEMAPRILAGDGLALEAIERSRTALNEPALFTIGYEARSLECYLNLLIKAGVTILCDVRRNPLSRKYGFSKKTLSHAVTHVGIRYEHLPELGIASEERRELRTQRDYDELFATYVATSLPQQAAALQLIGKWIQEGHRVALTCYEALPNQCHRHCVAEAVEKTIAEVCPLSHL